MPFVVRLEDYVPGQRDDEPWTQARIEEGPSDEGPWTVLETQDLDPVDTDPTTPATRNFTTALATNTADWFRVVFLDAAAAEQYTEPVYFPHPGTRPSLEEIASLIRARTKESLEGSGTEVGTFTQYTRPTDEEVRRVLDMAVGDVLARVGTVPEDLEDAVRTATALRTAMLIERAYFPEQTDEQQPAYLSLRFQWEEIIKRLTADMQLRTTFPAA